MANSEGCSEMGPTPSQLRLPLTETPSGVKTRTCRNSAPTRIGTDSAFHVADGHVRGDRHGDAADDRELQLLAEEDVGRGVVGLHERLHRRGRQHHDQADDDQDDRHREQDVVARHGRVEARQPGAEPGRLLGVGSRGRALGSAGGAAVTLLTAAPPARRALGRRRPCGRARDTAAAKASPRAP